MARGNQNDLTDTEKVFLDLYFRFKFNGRMAILHMKPHLGLKSADVEACRMLATEKMQVAVEKKHEQIRLQEEVELSWVVGELNKIILDVATEQTERDANGKITSKPDRVNAIRALALLSKLGGLEAPKKMDVNVQGKVDINIKDLLDFTDGKDNAS